MKFLNEMKQGLQDKIDKFLEEHPAAVLVKRHTNYGPYCGQIDLYRLLDKAGKETNFYLRDCIDRLRDDCGCYNAWDEIFMLEEDDPEKVKQYAENPGKELESVLFKAYKHILLKCSRGLPPEEKTAYICEMEAKYDLVEDLVEKIRKIKKKEE